MRTKHASTKFKKGDRVRVTKATLRRWRKDDKRIGYPDRASKYSGKVGKVTGTLPNPSPYPPAVMIRFEGGREATFLSDKLESA